MIILHSSYSISVVFFFVFTLLVSCTSYLNQENYLMCRERLEIDRQKVRLEGGYSYKAKSFEECRSPARYRIRTD